MKRMLAESHHFLIKATSALWAIPIVLLVRLIRPLRLVRFGSINSARIGHFVVEAGEYAARQRAATNTIDIFWLGAVSNEQWAKMVRRSLRVRGLAYFLDRWNRKIPGGAAHVVPSSSWTSTPAGASTERFFAPAFSPRENSEGLKWLEATGWKPDEPFVCLLVRDSRFLDETETYSKQRTRGRLDWSYHDYRDSNIQSYYRAIRWLSDRGVWVLRMGKIMESRLSNPPDRFIDYAFRSDRSDFLDVWLFANCSACVSTGSGPDALSSIYSRPQLMLNALPASSALLYGDMCTFSPKKLRWRSSDNELSIGEYLENSYFRSQDYLEAGLEVEDLSPSEISQDVKDFWALHFEGARPDARELAAQQQFRELYEAYWTDHVPSGRPFRPRGRVSTTWLDRAAKKGIGLLK